MPTLLALLRRHCHDVHSVLPPALRQRPLLTMDVSTQNPVLRDAPDVAQALLEHAEQLKQQHPGHILMSGYGEKRDLYTAPQFGSRCIHLGIDIDLEAGTEILCPLAAQIHSFGNTEKPGDYGPVIILQHQLENKTFYSLYGHLSRNDMQHWQVGKKIAANEVIGHIGTHKENGGWPPHLHLQLINDIGNHCGNYPGVCAPKETDFYFQNCPDPSIFILGQNH